MAKLARSTVFFWLTFILFSVGACAPLLASIRMTPLGDLALGITEGVEAYARDHEGALPKGWDNLRSYVDFERAERKFNASVQTKMMMLGDVHPTLDGADSVKIIAMTAFAINEDRREEIGRYVVVQRGDGTFTWRWANESAVLRACAAVNLTLPPAAVFQERPMGVHSLESAQRRMRLLAGSVAALIFAGIIIWRRSREAHAKNLPPEPDRLDETKDDVVIKW